MSQEVYRFEGDLVFATVPSLHNQLLNYTFPSKSLQVDLGDVARADSAGLALLMAFKRLAHRHQCQLQFLNLSPQLRTVAEAYGLDSNLDPE